MLHFDLFASGIYFLLSLFPVFTARSRRRLLHFLGSLSHHVAMWAIHPRLYGSLSSAPASASASLFSLFFLLAFYLMRLIVSPKSEVQVQTQAKYGADNSASFKVGSSCFHGLDFFSFFRGPNGSSKPTGLIQPPCVRYLLQVNRFPLHTHTHIYIYIYMTNKRYKSWRWSVANGPSPTRPPTGNDLWPSNYTNPVARLSLIYPNFHIYK